MSTEIATQRSSLTFVVLVAGEAGEETARVMRAHLNPECLLPAFVYLPSTRGRAYFDADLEEGRRLDAEWADNLDPATTIPVFVMLHEPGLEEFVPGLTGELVVGVPNARTRTLYQSGSEDLASVQTIVDTDPRVLMEFAMQCYLGARAEDQAFVGYDFEHWWREQPPPWEVENTDDIEMQTEEEAWGRFVPEGALSVAGNTPNAAFEQVAANEDDLMVTPESAPGVASEEPKRPGQEELDNLIELAKSGADAPSQPVDSAAIGYQEVPGHIQRLPPGLRPKGIADWLKNRAAATADEPPPPPPQPLPDTPLGYVSRAAWPPAPEVEPTSVEPVAASVVGSPTRVAVPTPSPKAAAGGILGLVGQAKAAAGGLLKMERKFKPPPELAQMLIEAAPLRVGVGSRKGGVGKTNDAAGMACVFGESLVLRGGKAILVDGNIGNPASWASAFPKGKEDALVCKVVEALMSGEIPPDPAWARTPGLAGYKEDRAKGEGYSAGEISELAEYLGKRYQAVIVDLHNSLPELGGAEQEVVLHWMHNIDVLVVPTDSDPDSVTAVHEFVDEIHKLVESWGDGAPALPVVVAYLSPPSRELREQPALIKALDDLDQRVQKIVEIPYDDRARIALWTERDILSVSPRLAQAYTLLASEVARAAHALVNR